jgi:DNA polymerase III epsilon subunit-like protein
MRLLIFDTETTGLPKFKEPALNAKDNWPHIVSISWVILDTDTNQIVTRKSFIVKPDGWIIPPESTEIHKISTQAANMIGTPLREVISKFLNETYNKLVAHNMEFDYNVLINAIVWDLGMVPETILRMPALCTMKLSKNICKIPYATGYGYKSPKLSELYEFAFKTKPISSSLHSSAYDASILSKIIMEFDPLRAAMGLPILNSNTNNGVQTKPSKTFTIRIDETN